MANPIAVNSRWSINCSQGNKKLRRLESSKVSDDSSVEAVTAQGEDFAVGVTEKPGAITITFTVYMEQGDPEINWDLLKNNKEWFGLTREIVGGRAYGYPECRVSKVEPSGDNSGKHMFDVEIIALKQKAL